MRFSSKKVAAAILGIGLLGRASPAVAFTVDGILTSANEYAGGQSWDLDFLVEGTGSGDVTVSGGNLRIARDGAAGDIFMFVSVPVAVVDNVYGTAAETAGSGWNPPDHPFDKLKGSDAFEFDLNVGGTDKFIKVEYIENDGTIEIKDDGEGVLKEETLDGDGYVDPATTGVNTSLSYNFREGFDDRTDLSTSPDPIAGSPDPGWVQAVQYEFRLDGSNFASGTTIGLGDISNAVLHASPNKQDGDNKVLVPCLEDNSCTPITTTTTTSISEPSTAAVFGAGLAMVAMVRRRRSTAV